jgi:hypothetical protein
MDEDSGAPAVVHAEDDVKGDTYINWIILAWSLAILLGVCDVHAEIVQGALRTA